MRITLTLLPGIRPGGANRCPLLGSLEQKFVTRAGGILLPGAVNVVARRSGHVQEIVALEIGVVGRTPDRKRLVDERPGGRLRGTDFLWPSFR